MPSPPPDAPHALRFTVPRDQIGRELLDFLQVRFPYFPPGGWHDRLVRGRVTLNDAPTPPDTPLQLGDRIAYMDWDIPEPEVNTAYTIVHRDAQLIAINKPAGLPSHPGGRYLHNCLTALLRRDLALTDPILVNRLDRETSGLMLVALDRRSAKLLQQQFARRQVAKRYIAIVEGVFPNAVAADGFMVRDTDSPIRKRRRFLPAADAPPGLSDQPDVDTALTYFTSLRTDGTLSEIEARPATGRTHQIRATLLALGFPVVGDKLYGVDPENFLRFCNNTLRQEDHARLRLDRQALHASHLTLQHPATRQPLNLEAPLPDDLRQLAQQMRPA